MQGWLLHRREHHLLRGLSSANRSAEPHCLWRRVVQAMWPWSDSVQGPELYLGWQLY